MLGSRKLDPNSVNGTAPSYKDGPIIRAVELRNVEMVEMLLAHSKPNGTPGALVQAARAKDYGIVKLLLDSGQVDPDEIYDSTITPLHETIRDLCSKESDVQTPLILELLLTSGANPLSRGSNLGSPLKYSINVKDGESRRIPLPLEYFNRLLDFCNDLEQLRSCASEVEALASRLAREEKLNQYNGFETFRFQELRSAFRNHPNVQRARGEAGEE